MLYLNKKNIRWNSAGKSGFTALWKNLAALLMAGLACTMLLSACHSSIKHYMNEDGIMAAHAWVRPTPPGTTLSAAYLVLYNKGKTAVQLVRASTSVARVVEMHEVIAAKSGTMQMRPVEKISLPPGNRVEFKPGGYHIMLIDLKTPIKEGDKVDITLHFSSGAPLPITAVASLEGGKGMMHHHHHGKKKQ